MANHNFIHTGYGCFCPECGTFYTFYEVDNYYLKYPLNCKMCGNIFLKKENSEINKQLSFFD